MEFILDAKDFNDNLDYKQETNNKLSKTEIKEYKTGLDLEFGRIDFHEIELNSCTILISSYNLKHKLILKNTIKENFIEMHFNLGGNITIKENSIPIRKITIDGMTHNLIGISENTSGSIDYTEGKFFKTFDVHLKDVFLEKWYGHNKALDFFIEEYKTKNTTLLYPNNMPITMKMQDVISQVINCEFKGITRLMYLESKIQELFCLQIEQSHLCFNYKKDQKIKLTSYDVEKINFAKQYIEENLQKKISIIELSKITSINQQKLKKGFKDLFGTTIFNYAQFCRMNKAREMLLEKSPINEVCTEIGYANPSSFSHAFKAFYGFAPKKLTTD